jgi:putative tricarboxylic transport membrane protein
VTGALGLLLAAGYLALSTQYSFGALYQPGARVWPTIVGLMLVAASLFVLWEAWRMAPSERFTLPAGAGAWRVVVMIALLAGYFAAMNFLGQFIASTLFCVLFMRLVSPLSWPRLVAASLAITVVLHLVFVTLLKIPMPKGLLGP